MVSKKYYVFLKLDGWTQVVFDSVLVPTAAINTDFYYTGHVMAENAYAAISQLDLLETDWSIATAEDLKIIYEHFKFATKHEEEIIGEDAGEQTAEDRGSPS